MLDKYTVTLRGESFTLYRDQIEFDTPNYFSDLFLGDFSESQTRSVELSRSPELFRAIVDYLSGYNVLPLTSAVIPPSMTPETALENLLRDAEFYGLRGLVTLLRSQSSHTVTSEPLLCLAYLRGLGLVEPVVEISSLLLDKLPAGVICDQRGVGRLHNGTWHPVPLKASGLLAYGRYTSMVLTDPLLGQSLRSVLQQRGLSVHWHQSYQGLQCQISRSANVSVEGIETVANRVGHPSGSIPSLSAAPPEPDELDQALLRIIAGSDNGNVLVLVATSIIFTIKQRPGGSPSDSAEGCIIAARFVSRATAARYFL